MSDLFAFGVAASLASFVVLGTVQSAEPTSVQFNRDIRQILADNCYTCHGPDKNKREAELRLDEAESAYANRDGKHAIAPGKPDESEIIRRILSTNPDERMPPDSTGKSISPKQIELLRAWIQQGAKFEKHWSLIVPTRPSHPELKDTNFGKSWARNDIDHFILARLEQAGLKPSIDADRRTLVRRLSFDLTGLPPSPADVEAFVNDQSPDAYAKVVDHFLSSPHYGERMAMYWLDVVRYADSAGYHSDNERSIWPYRDYVIQSFNDNKPFDKFTVEQLAGDLIPNATREQKIASGYNRLLQTTEEGGAQPKEYTAKYQADRVRNTAVIWMAATMGCCECHNHKFDPFTTRDFYRMGAFFADVQEKPVGRQDQTPVPYPEQEAALQELDKKLGIAREQLNRISPELTAAQAAWEKIVGVRLSAASKWKTLTPDKVEAAGGTVLTKQDDGSYLASGPNPEKETYTVTTKVPGDRVTALRIETLTHPSLANKSLSRANGNFVLTEVEVSLETPGKAPQPLKIKTALADFSQDSYPIELAIDGKADTGWAVNGHVTAGDHRAIFILEQPLAVSPDSTFVVRIRQESQFAKHNIGRFRVAANADDMPTLDDAGGLPKDVVEAFGTEPEKRDDAKKAIISKHFRSIAPELVAERQQVADLEKQRVELTARFPQTLITISTTPRVVRILPRGNWLDDSGEVVDPSIPETIGGLSAEGRASRLDLAKWMASPNQPLVSRVFVNRLWKICFGQGLVKTVDDFGAQGEWPSHPELLDWLAVEFRDSGWNVKHMMKLMVLSRTYQQSSASTKELREKDPANRLLARQASYRLEAEFVRDNALAVSGLLARKLGGPSVKPYQPAGYWRYLNFPTREWQNDTGEGLYRRGLYTHWQRTFLHPSLAAFDAPSREESCCDRTKSNTPLQALALLNDPTFVESARVLATSALQKGGANDQDRLKFIFQQVLQRMPNEHESKVLGDLVAKHREQYSAEPATAAEVLKVGETKPPEGISQVDLAAWTSATRVILNLHETITRN